MQIKTIRVGKWYETRQGIGECLQVGGTHPPSVKVRIVAPFPRGTVFLAPRDLLAEVDPPMQRPNG